jgi:adenylate cyclase
MRGLTNMFESNLFRKALQFYATDTVVQRVSRDKESALQPWYEALDATVFVQDVAGFASFAAYVSPEQLLQSLNKYLDNSSKNILLNGGNIVDFVGDSIIAYWQGGHEARKACAAAVANVGVLKNLSSSSLSFSAQIGIASGKILLANTGGQHHLKLQLIGDSMNLTSRLSAANRNYRSQIILHESIAKQVPDLPIRELDLVRVKGRLQPEGIFELLV